MAKIIVRLTRARDLPMTLLGADNDQPRANPNALLPGGGQTRRELLVGRIKNSRSNTSGDSSDDHGTTKGDDTGTDEPGRVNSLFLTLDCRPEGENQAAGR